MSYRIQNWAEYNKALVQRGNISIWFCEAAIKQAPAKTGKRGAPKKYSDALIEVCWSVKILYKLPYRATEGFLRSFFHMLSIDAPVPSYSQLSRRAKALNINLHRVFQNKGAIDVAIDSTGLKIYGEGEWKVRKHGADKRRTWRKLHLAVDPLDHEIVAIVSSSNSIGDAAVFDDLLSQINTPIERCFGDGAYDTRECYKSCFDKNISLVTPPCINAIEDTQCEPHMIARNKAVSQINSSEKTRSEARAQWKHESDYHCRSNAETAMHRFKKIFGDTLSSRDTCIQDVEVMIKVNLLNKMTNLGMPITYIK